MKKFITAFLAISLLIPLCAYVHATDIDASDSIKIYVDGDRVITENKPVIENSRTLAPIRAVAEKAGIQVGWIAESSTVTLRYEFQSASITIGSNKMKVYNSIIDEMKSVTLDAVPRIINSSTYITLRAALEAVGAKVEWDADTQSIYVTSPKESSTTASESNNNTNTVTDESISGKTSEKSTEDKNTVLRYEGFRNMKDDKVTEGAPHGLYGRILSDTPITLVRCCIVGSEFDGQLRFNASDNITSYNVFTYFDKLMCFSDAGIGEQIFEIYAAADGAAPQLLFTYKYTVVPKETPAEENTENEDDNADDNPENDNVAANTSENNQKDSLEGSSEDNSENTSEDTSENSSENSDEAETSEKEPEEVVPVVSYYGFRKMTDNKIVSGAPHGLYGNVVSNVPLTGVRCRIANTEMDYSINLDSVNEITSYNVFTYFDKLICFSDASVGAQTFEIYASAEGTGELLVFSYDYTVITEEETAQEEADENASEDSHEYDVCLPLEGDIKLTSPYGFRAYNKWEFHKGIDIISASTNILSVADGTVVDCKTGINSGAGNYVAIQHEGGWVSLYYHLKSYSVSIGDKVEKGEKIAIMGRTGGNYGVHLHFMTCDNWYGSLWATQNSHHTAPHEYVPQILSAVENYTPNYEKENKDKVIICNFHFPSEIEQGKPYSISRGKGCFAFEANTLESVTFTVTDTEGNILLEETQNEPEVYSDSYYNYSDISVELDKLCEFDTLPTGKMIAYISVVTENGRERVVYTKEFEVKAPSIENTEDSEAPETPSEEEITDEITVSENTSDTADTSVLEEADTTDSTSETANVSETSINQEISPENELKNEDISEAESGLLTE